MDIKKLLFIISLLLFANATYAQESNKQKFKKLEWLVGKWNRTNAKPGQSGYETWLKVSDSKMSGKGVTLKGTQVIFLENLEFISKGNDIYYTVVVTGEKEPVYFTLTSISSEGFTCENPDHDFPKKITYSHNGNHAKAVISGNGQSFDYIFIRAKK